MHDEGGQGRKYVATDNLVFDAVVRENRGFSMDDLCEKFCEVSRPKMKKWLEGRHFQLTRNFKMKSHLI